MITVLSPAYNKGATIERTFESLKAQTCFDFEWLIVNDGSTDNTQNIVDTFKTSLFLFIHIAYLPFEIIKIFGPLYKVIITE